MKKLSSCKRCRDLYHIINLVKEHAAKTGDKTLFDMVKWTTLRRDLEALEEKKAARNQ